MSKSKDLLDDYRVQYTHDMIKDLGYEPVKSFNKGHDIEFTISKEGIEYTFTRPVESYACSKDMRDLFLKHAILSSEEVKQ